MTKQPITLSLFDNAGSKTLSKYLYFDDRGKLRKRHAASLVRGIVKRISCFSLQEVYDLMHSLKPHQAVSFGICQYDEAIVLSQSAAKEYTGQRPMVTRTRKNFSWPAAQGIILFDYDPPPGTEPMTFEELIKALREAVPALSCVTLAVKPSVSSCIYTTGGRTLKGISGQHVFAIVENANEIPTIGATISERLWLAGYGHITIGGNGRMLERTVIDTSVWQPERLVFASAECADGIKQQFPLFDTFPGACDELLGEDSTIASGSIPPLSDDEKRQVAKLKADARAKAQPAAQQKKQEWIEQRAKEAACYKGKADDQEIIARYKQQFNRVIEEGDVLSPYLILYPKEGGQVTAAEVYANPDKWHGHEFADPMEPDYGNGDPRIAIAFLKDNEEPYVYSHAHHGTYYYFRSEGKRRAPAEDDFDAVDITDIHPMHATRFQVIDAEEFANGPEPEWVIDGILPEGELAMIFGPSGSGKTFFVLDLIAAIALGHEWNGHTIKQGKVVYVAAEGVGGFRKRIQAYEKHHGVSLKHILGVIEETPSFLNQDNLDLAKSINDWGKPRVIVVDTLAQTTSGADENSSEGIGRALQKCKNLSKQTGALVLLVHHTGKNEGKGARGWSGIRAALDTEIEITQKDNIRQARITKQKDEEDGKCFSFKLLTIDLGENAVGKKKTSCVVKFTEALPGSKKGPVSKTKLTSKWQKKVYDAILRRSEFTLFPLAVGDIIDDAITNEPYDLKRDRRRESGMRALSQIAEAGHIQIHNNQIYLPQTHNPPQMEQLWN